MNCWFSRDNKLTRLPFDQVEEKNLCFCDPFDAYGADDIGRLIRKRKLEYVGEANVRGRRCYQIRSYDIKIVAEDFSTPILQWSIDAETFRPVRVEMDDRLVNDYVDVNLTEIMLDNEFRPPVDGGIQLENSAPLTEGYTRRYLDVSDGSDGRMSVRWGMKGPKGTLGGGLN